MERRGHREHKEDDFGACEPGVGELVGRCYIIELFKTATPDCTCRARQQRRAVGRGFVALHTREQRERVARRDMSSDGAVAFDDERGQQELLGAERELSQLLNEAIAVVRAQNRARVAESQQRLQQRARQRRQFQDSPLRVVSTAERRTGLVESQVASEHVASRREHGPMGAALARDWGYRGASRDDDDISRALALK